MRFVLFLKDEFNIANYSEQSLYFDGEESEEPEFSHISMSIKSLSQSIRQQQNGENRQSHSKIWNSNKNRQFFNKSITSADIDNAELFKEKLNNSMKDREVIKLENRLSAYMML